MRQARAWAGGVGVLALLTVAGCAQIEELLPGSEADDAADAARPTDLSGQVLLEPVGSEGPDPFTASVAAPVDERVAAFAAEGPPEPADAALAAALEDPAEAIEQRDDGQAVADGDVAGLYGGSQDARSCDVAQLAEALAQHPERAEAWAGVVGVAPSALPAYLGTLTPLRLSVDTRVVNHGFVDGRARPHEAVLQRGTAVLVDQRGVPRVRCACGNPLGISEARPAEHGRTGEAWASLGDDVGGAVVVEPASEVINEFEVVNTDPDAPDDEVRLAQEVGADGDVAVHDPLAEGDTAEDGDADGAAGGEPVSGDPDGCEPFTVDGEHYQVVVHETSLDPGQACVYTGHATSAFEALADGEEPGLGCEPAFAALLDGQAVDCRTGTGDFTVSPLGVAADDASEGQPGDEPEAEGDEAEPSSAFDPEDDFCAPFSVDGSHYQVVVHWYDPYDGSLEVVCDIATESAIDHIRSHLGQGEPGEVTCQEALGYVVEFGLPNECWTSWFATTLVALGDEAPDGPDDGIVFCDPLSAAGGQYQIGLPERYLEQGFADCADFAVILGPDLGDYLVMGLEPAFLEECRPSFAALGEGQQVTCSFGPDELVLRPAGGEG